MTADKTLTVIIPAYNEEQMIQKAYDVINCVLSENKIPHGFVFVDDGSSDGTWSIIKRITEKDNSVTGVRFSRNFGKESAISAGLHYVGERLHGGCCAVIDCDLQHPPEKLVDMYNLWMEGYEVIEGKKNDRGQEKIAHRLCAVTFYAMMKRITGFDFMRASDFKLLDEKPVLAILNMKEKNAFFRALSAWVGFKTTQVDYDVKDREAGESKWSFKSLFKYAVNNLSSFTMAPMQFVTFAGIIAFLAAIIFGIISLVQSKSNVSLVGWPLILFIQLLTSGMIMMALGIIGLYLSKVYEQVRGRPKYIITEIIGYENK